MVLGKRADELWMIAEEGRLRAFGLDELGYEVVK